jgi:dephospho-CoA kinase
MIIGLTGGIAAGKSTVSQHLASRPGLQFFDADALVHRLLAEDPKVADLIGKQFGPGYLRPDGAPDRAALRGLVFGDPEARRRLEAILHPKVRSEWLALRDECLASQKPFLADIPLLYETGAEAFFDTIIVVACSPVTQMVRIGKRGVAPETAHHMLASQLPLGQKLGRADVVIWNDGSLATLERQIELAANQLFPA